VVEEAIASQSNNLELRDLGGSEPNALAISRRREAR